MATMAGLDTGIGLEEGFGLGLRVEMGLGLTLSVVWVEPGGLYMTGKTGGFGGLDFGYINFCSIPATCDELLDSPCGIVSEPIL